MEEKEIYVRRLQMWWRETERKGKCITLFQPVDKGQIHKLE